MQLHLFVYETTVLVNVLQANNTGFYLLISMVYIS